MLIYDPGARSLVVGPLLVAIGALLLSGVAFAEERPPAAVLAAATTLIIATAWVLVSSAARLFSLLLQYVAPVNFAKVVLRDVDTFLSLGATEMVVFRVGLLGEMVRTSIRRGDNRGTRAGLEALRRLRDIYISAATTNPAIRRHGYDAGEFVGWLGPELRAAAVAAGTEALTAGAPEADAEAAASLLTDLGAEAIQRGWSEEWDEAVQGLAELGTCVQQMVSSGAVNFYAPAAFGLARLESQAEEQGDLERAAWALAHWLLVTSYWAVHYRINEQAAIQRGLYELGPQAPWHSAHDILVADEWEDRWLNKMPNGPMAVVGTLGQALEAHGQYHGRVEVPTPQEDLEDLKRLVERRRPGRLHRLWTMLAAGLPDG